MAKLTLTPAVAERLGVPEVTEFEFGHWSLKALDGLETEVGMTLDELVAAVFVPAGQRRSSKAMLAFVWLVLRTSGQRLSWDDFDLAGSDVRLDLGEPPIADETAEAADEPRALTPVAV